MTATYAQRHATAGDAVAIARIEAASADRPWTAEQVASSLALPTTRAWVALAGDAVVGHLLTTEVAGTAEVLIIAVDPEHRRRGIARRLLITAMLRWQAERIQEGYLEVRTDNGPAIALYRALGWVERGRRPGYYRDGTDALILAVEP